jgi:hypothetical protein
MPTILEIYNGEAAGDYLVQQLFDGDNTDNYALDTPQQLEIVKAAGFTKEGFGLAIAYWGYGYAIVTVYNQPLLTS